MLTHDTFHVSEGAHDENLWRCQDPHPIMTTPVSTNLQKNVTLEEYFELDLASDEKLEY